jgi:hypothetical protein
VAVVRGGGDAGAELELVVVSVVDGSSVQVAGFHSLRPVALAWDRHGRWLAFAQGSELAVWDGTETVVRHRVGAPQWLSFDAAGDLWLLGADGLWCARSRDGFGWHVRHDDVVSASVASEWAAAVGRDGELRLRYEAHGRLVERPWPLAATGRPRVRCLEQDQPVFVAADRPCGPGRTEFELARIDRPSGETVELFSGRIATALGWREPAWIPWLDGSALVLAERGEAPAIVRCHPGELSRPIGPRGFEVSALAASPASGRIAAVGAPTDSAERGESWLVELDGDQGCEVIREGINSLAAWDRRGRSLFYLHSPELGVAEVCVEARPGRARRLQPLDRKAVARDARPDEFALSGPADRQAALIYLTGPHRRLVDGAQLPLFQHALISLAARCAHDGYLAVCLNPPGSTGRGRAYREPQRPWSAVAREALAARLESLREAGHERIAVITGSLGVIPVIGLLQAEELAAAVLISPVYQSAIPALEPWQHLFDDACRTVDIEAVAQRIRTPLLIAHGVRDEMAGIGASSRLVTHLAPDREVEYLTLNDEGHIFSRRTSWDRVLQTSYDFLRRQLGRS